MKKLFLESLAFAVALLSMGACQQNEQDGAGVQPELVSVIPVKGTAGTTVIISGLNFSENMKENSVTFGGAEAVVRASTSNRLTVTAPSNEDGEYPVTVTVNGRKAEGFTFTYATPAEPEMSISGISPAEGFVGDEVAIMGENFSPVASDMTVMFGEKQARVLQSSASLLRVTAPENQKGSVGVVVTYGSKTATALFTYLNLAITDVSPASGVEGTEVTIKGEGFGETVDANTVLVNGSEVRIKSASASELVVIMPKLPAGTYGFTVRARGHEVVGGSFTVEAVYELAITGNQPEAGGSGTIVILSGTGFSTVPEENTVTLGTVVLPVKAATESALAVEIPSMEDGTYEFTVKVAEKQVTGGKFNYGKVWYVETVAGDANETRGTVDGIGQAARLAFPQDICVASDGRIYFTQRNKGYDTVRELNPSNWAVSTLIPTGTEKLDGNAIYNASFLPDNSFLFAVKDGSKSAATGGLFGKLSSDKALSLLELPEHKLKTNEMNVTGDADGNIYVLNRNSGTAGKESYVSVYDKNLALVHDWPLSLFANYIVWNPSRTKLLIGTVGAPQWGIFELDPKTGEYERVVGGNSAAPAAATFADGPAESATIGRIEGMCVAPDGTIYFSDLTCKTIRKVVPGAGGDYKTGTVSTVAGTNFKAGKTVGLASETLLTNPGGVAVLSDGSILYCEPTLYEIRRIYAK